MDKEIVIMGRYVRLRERSKAGLKGVTVGDSLAYRFFDGEFHDVPLLFAEPKGNVASPKNLAITAGNLSAVFQLPVVFIMPSCPAYLRHRLIDKYVYFVISDKYAHLPMLVANERIRKTKPAKRLTPVAQYLLFYHLQVESLEGMAARDFQSKVPYSYASITLGITCLADLDLCEKIADGSKRKTLHFGKTGYDLWQEALPVLINPVEQTVYCDEFHCDEHFPVSGINALAHYTWLKPDPERIIMMSKKRLRELSDSGALIRPNEYDGNIIIEEWKYPPVTKIDELPEWVDPLSLAISLQDNHDPRVENEVERLINEIKWKG